MALKTLAQQVQLLDLQIRQIRSMLPALINASASDLLSIYGVGVDNAAILFVADGDDPQRLESEAAFAHLCGVAPLPAS